MVATALEVLLLWFAVSVITALVAGRFIHHGTDDCLEDYLAAQGQTPWVALSLTLRQLASKDPASF